MIGGANPVIEQDVAPITSLSGKIGPSHVARLVTLRVVDTVKAVFRRRLGSNMLKKGCERADPFVAHLDTASAVVTIMFIGGISATVLSGLPSVVFCGAAHAVLRPPFTIAIGFQAAATTSLAVKICASHADELSAFASAAPPNVWRFGLFDDGQASKHRTSQILLFHRWIVSMAVIQVNDVLVVA